ncbi:alpha-galactosidase, partial [[Eubacterium] siraeum]|nr:alpha-galactosidase [[Eubacterium] siraeum]
RLIKVTQYDEPTGIEVISTFRFYDGISIERTYTEVRNTSATETYTLTYVSSFNFLGFEKEGILPRDDKFIIKIPHNSWQKDMLWQDYTFEQLGMPQCSHPSFCDCG